MPKRAHATDLQRAIHELSEQFRRLPEDDLFVLWFVRAFISDSIERASESICGGSGDKSADAVFIDDQARVCFVVQGKYRLHANKPEKRADAIAFGQLAVELFDADASWKQFREGMSPEVAQRLDVVRERAIKRGYETHFYYVTTGTVSQSVRADAEKTAGRAARPTWLRVFDGVAIDRLYGDYLDGVAPPVPSVDLEMEGGKSELLQRFDRHTEIESWIFSMADVNLAALYRRSGVRLFARNVRGYLGGNTVVNRGIEETLQSEPERFWYYNNGVTIVCDAAEYKAERGRSVLRVTNPQIINGQQTTRTLAESNSRKARASVLVRVIRVPRASGEGGSDQFESLVSKIVSATNSQNSVSPSDLMSNDRRQIDIERQLRKQGYWYIRKRQKKGEVRRSGASRHYTLVKKEELAQAVAACDLDPSIVREGKERLFEERMYLRVFPNADPQFYLPRYWVLRHAAYHVRHGKDRSYAKWLVANYLWSRLAPLVRSRAGCDAFIRLSEKPSADSAALDNAIGALYTAVARFHRGARQRDDAGDWDAFSRRRGLDRQFETFWKSSMNKSRRRFDREWDRFARILAD